VLERDAENRTSVLRQVESPLSSQRSEVAHEESEATRCLARGVLDGDGDAREAALRELQAFNEIRELGSSPCLRGHGE
jgi:hypothetical protein